MVHIHIIPHPVVCEEVFPANSELCNERAVDRSGFALQSDSMADDLGTWMSSRVATRF